MLYNQVSKDKQHVLHYLISQPTIHKYDLHCSGAKAVLPKMDGVHDTQNFIYHMIYGEQAYKYMHGL